MGSKSTLGQPGASLAGLTERTVLLKRFLSTACAVLALLTLACGLSPVSTAAPPAARTEVVVEPYATPTTAASAPPPAPATSPAVTPSAVPVLAKALDQANLRSGPSLDSTVVGQLNAGDAAPILGRSYDVPWFLVAWPSAPGGQAWVYRDVVTVVGDLYSVPVMVGTPGASPVASATQPPTPAPGATPYGCQKPGDDYTTVSVGDGIIINRRTYDMLVYAQGLYGGKHDFLKAITQGSYSPGVAASFGTHDGGGAVDISVRDLSTFAVLTDQLPAIVLALREAGFAAWVREPDELGPGSPIHIHMIAIGDKDLSPAARRQVDGKEGYFRGFNGLPVDPPVADKWGPPILCPWMADLGYSDLRGSP